MAYAQKKGLKQIKLEKLRDILEAEVLCGDDHLCTTGIGFRACESGYVDWR